MSRTDIKTYLTSLEKSGLVDKVALSQLLARVVREAGDRRIDVDWLAQRFEEEQLVTAWHNKKLLQGRYRGFFLGRYKLLSHIASGGMSTIYLAEHVQMRRQVAIKVLPPVLTNKASHLDRFYVESQIIASLDHPNIVKAYDVAQEKDFHYLVLEYVDGWDLQRLVGREGPLGYEVAAEYIRQVAEGLHYAHQRNLVHRDVKPANLLVAPEQTVKILDLGLSRIISTQEPSLTLAHGETLLGTVDYIAPEQAANCHEVDHRADIYSLGCTFYFLLVGTPPFPRGSQTQRLMAHQEEPLPDIRHFRPDCSEDLLAIIDRMTAKEPNHRYQTAADLGHALAQWLEVQQEPPAAPSAETPSGEVIEADSHRVQGGSPEGASRPVGLPEPTADLSSGSVTSSQSEGFGNLEQWTQLEALRSELEARQAELARFQEGLQTQQAKLQDWQMQLEARSAALQRWENRLRRHYVPEPPDQQPSDPHPPDPERLPRLRPPTDLAQPVTESPDQAQAEKHGDDRVFSQEYPRESYASDQTVGHPRVDEIDAPAATEPMTARSPAALSTRLMDDQVSHGRHRTRPLQSRQTNGAGTRGQEAAPVSLTQLTDDTRVETQK